MKIRVQPRKTTKPIESPQKESTTSIGKDKGKQKKVYKKIASILGSSIHVYDETKEEIKAVNPKQFQKIAKTTYESHLKKIEVTLLVDIRIIMMEMKHMVLIIYMFFLKVF